MVDAVAPVCGGCSKLEEKDDNFCTSCGLKLPKFCSKCEKRKINYLCYNKTRGNAPNPLKTLQDFIQQKGKSTK